MDKLTPLKRAVNEILGDDRVTKDHIGTDEIYLVETGAGPLRVHRTTGGLGDAAWAAFYPGSLPNSPHPTHGLQGSRSSRPELAIVWCLLD